MQVEHILHLFDQILLLLLKILSFGITLHLMNNIIVLKRKTLILQPLKIKINHCKG